jgi:hypothetical protein
MQAIDNAPDEKFENFKTTRAVFNNITIELSKFMWYKHTQLDDITLIVLHYKNDLSKKSSVSNENNSDEIVKEFITEWKW